MFQKPYRERQLKTYTFYNYNINVLEKHNKAGKQTDIIGIWFPALLFPHLHIMPQQNTLGKTMK